MQPHPFKSKSQLWKIHGKWYDLKDYMKRHPGGEDILKQTQGQGDVSALFETYHAFAEIETLHEMISKFEVEKQQILKDESDEDSEQENESTQEESVQEEDDSQADDDSDEFRISDSEEKVISSLYFEKQFDILADSHISTPSVSELEEPEEPIPPISATGKWGEFDFASYRQLAKQIKEYFPDRVSAKAPLEWYFMVGYFAILFLYTFTNAMFASDTHLKSLIIFPLPLSWCSMEEQCIILRNGMTLLASISWISLGFNVMHDASHYAITPYPSVNQYTTKIWNALNLWNSKIWFYHHIFHHHSFTGLANRDPDISNYYPFAIKKQEDTYLESIWQWSYESQPQIVPILLFAFPGISLGQTISYIFAAFERKIWHISLPDLKQIPEIYDPIDLLCVFATIASFEMAIIKGHFMNLFLFLAVNNILYALNVIFDHDTFESIVMNDYGGKEWLKVQVQHSSNFLNKNIYWTRIFGSINYQIEHHLFPSMSSYHYPKIKPIVQRFCIQNNIPYTHHTTLLDAWESFLKTLHFNKPIAY